MARSSLGRSRPWRSGGDGSLTYETCFVHSCPGKPRFQLEGIDVADNCLVQNVNGGRKLNPPCDDCAVRAKSAPRIWKNGVGESSKAINRYLRRDTARVAF